jgi:4-amino-4-deoxy-L-arabinose transferase-like glycosyltransferase
VLLSAWTIVTVSKIAERLYGRRAGLLAAWMTALYPPLIFMNGRVMSETLFIALLTFSLYRFLLSDRSERVADGVVAGGLFAVSALVRSNLLVMFPLLPLWQLLRPKLALNKRLLTAIATTAVAGAIVLLPGLYFLSVKGEFLPSATNAGQTFYGANNPLADGGWVQMEDHQEYLRSIPPEVRKKASAYSKAQFKLGFDWIRENPGAFLLLLPKKFGNAWVPGFQSSETTTSSKLAGLILIAVTAPLLLAAIAGRIKNQPSERDGLLLAVLATYTVMSLAFYGNPRIGLFCSPILIIYASSWARRFDPSAPLPAALPG